MLFTGIICCAFFVLFVSPASVRRVVIMAAAVIFLGESMNTNKLIGASIAVAGTLAYSLAKNSAAEAAKKAKKKA